MEKGGDRKEEDQEERQNLLRDIEQLKQLISQLESTIKLRALGYTCYPVDHVDINFEMEKVPEEIPDVELELEQELYILSGIHCVNFKNVYTFIFSAGRKVTKKNQYAVQVVNEDGIGKLGKWVLPMSVNMDEILKDYPIEDLNNIIYFLRSCRHQVLCHGSREEQYHQLKELLLNVVNARLEASFGYTKITIEFMGLKENKSNETFDIILYLLYKSDGTQPSKLIPDSLGENELPRVMLKSLQKYFKHFISSDLVTAFEETIKTNSAFVWEKKMRCDDIIDMKNTSTEEFCGDMDLSKRFSQHENNITEDNNKLTDFEDTLKNTQQHVTNNRKKGNSFIDENEENGDIENAEEKTEVTEMAVEAKPRNPKRKKTSVMQPGKKKDTKKKKQVT